MNEKLSNFGRITRVKRVLSGESLTTVSNATGFSVSLLSAAELGDKPATADLAMSLASHFKMTKEETLDLLRAVFADAKEMKLHIDGEFNEDLTALFAMTTSRMPEDQKRVIAKFLQRQFDRHAIGFENADGFEHMEAMVA